MKTLFRKTLLILLAGLLAPYLAYGQDAEFDEFEPIIEINATDGDVGFHVLLDGDAWRGASIFSNDVERMIQARASASLREQGVTEFFLESAEPLCWNDPEADPDEEVVTLEEFLERFESGTYLAFGRDLDLELIKATGRLTHNIPAAPEVNVEVDGATVTVSWDVGTDLGNCAYPNTIPDPAGVEVVRWEIVVEPDEDELPEDVEFAKFTAQLLGDARELVVPASFIQQFLDADVTAFKGEVGAKEDSGNQTFTEIEFEIEAP